MAAAEYQARFGQFRAAADRRSSHGACTMRAKKFKGTKTLEFQWREEDLNALFRGPEPRVLTATLSRNSRPQGPKSIGSALFLHEAE